ncbi:MAG: 3-demethylubiquinone-9 3-methyltransferase, partial [Acidobacteria bacterium]|nr:3-demethylubiquinone-9 3-methyltransferase [Acidobacteriota bacterium]
MKGITPNLWFDNQAEEAANFYVSIFPNSKVGTISRYDEAASQASGRPKGSAMTVSFELNGQPYLGLNGGPMFKFSEAISFIVNCESQEEVDRFWEQLTADGGQEVQCGWCRDKFGLSWQVVPDGMEELFSDPDPARAERAMKA